MMRFYHIDDERCLDMPFARLMALYRASQQIELEEELRMLGIVHSGDPKKHGQQIEAALTKMKPKEEQIRTAMPTATYVALNQGASFEAEPGSIARERARQKEAAERLEREWREQQKAAKSG